MCAFTRKWFLAFFTSTCYITSECFFPSTENKTLTRFKRQSTPVGTGCFLPQHPQNGKWKVIYAPGNFQPGDRVDSGTILEFKCNTQYALYPNNSLVSCLGSSIVVPQCLRTCSPIVSTETRTVKCTLNEVPVDCHTPYHGTKANIRCKSLYEDFTLASRPNRFCDDGSWDYNLLICEPVCGLKTTDATPLVIGGRVATRGDYPWVIGIYNSTQMQICAGSMISRSITLSAAHCFGNGTTPDPSKYFLAAGKYYRDYKDERDTSAQYSNVKEIKVHNDYSTDYYVFDIAILVLETPFVISKFVLPVCMHYNTRYHESELIGQKGIVAGWGFTTSVGQPSDVLKEVEVVYKTEQSCNLDDRRFLTYGRKMCGIAATAGSGACRGDSGGGLYFKNEERNEKYGRYFIRGIVSVGALDKNTFGCDATKSTLFTGVHHHAELIQSYANKNRIKGSNQSRPTPGVTNNEKMVVCCFSYRFYYRSFDGKYLPSDVTDADLCTHITYGNAELDPKTLTIKTGDSWVDIDQDFYGKVVAYKKKGIKVLISLGGFGEFVNGNKYSRLVNSPASRAKFIEDTIKFIEKYDFDGLDLLNWKYLNCWQKNCAEGPISDKQAFAQFVAELRAAFNPRGWLLSAAVSNKEDIIDNSYDVPSLSQNVDWIAVMCYDYHGFWDKKTGHVAPLYYYPGDDHDHLNTNYTIHNLIKLGADPKKLVMGMPSYGRSFALADVNEHGLNARSDGPGDSGWMELGTLAFYKICGKVKRSNWKVVRDPEGRTGPYAYSGNQWVSYDDIADIRRKSELVKDWGLGGGMLSDLDYDDFRNRCGCGKNPLLRNMNNVLRNVPLDEQIGNCT